MLGGSKESASTLDHKENTRDERLDHKENTPALEIVQLLKSVAVEHTLGEHSTATDSICGPTLETVQRLNFGRCGCEGWEREETGVVCDGRVDAIERSSR